MEVAGESRDSGSNLDLTKIDRRFIYLMVLIALSIPIFLEYVVEPAPMKAAEKFYQQIESIEPGTGKIALVSLDFGPNLVAENGSQTLAVMEHLMRRRIPFAVMSLYQHAEPFLKSYPEDLAKKLMAEMPDQRWVYGVDWVNLGFQVGGSQRLLGMAKANSLIDFFKKDAFGNDLSELAAFSTVHTLQDISMVVQFTGLVGMLDAYLQFLQTEDYRPTIVHGCTSIVIPDAFIFLDSGQISGLLEGIAGAAWYSKILTQNFPNRPADSALVINTALGIAHLVIIFLIIIGNLGMYLAYRKRRAAR